MVARCRPAICCYHTQFSAAYWSVISWIIPRLKYGEYSLRSDIKRLYNFVLMGRMESLLGNVRSSQCKVSVLPCPLWTANKSVKKRNEYAGNFLSEQTGTIIIARHQSFALLQRIHAECIAAAIVNFPSASQINKYMLLGTLFLGMYNTKPTSERKCFLVCLKIQISLFHIGNQGNPEILLWLRDRTNDFLSFH